MRVGVLVLLVMVAGCGGQIPLVTPELVSAAQARWPASTSESLARGREVLMTNCARCHRAPIPSDHTETEWIYYLREMGPRAQLQPGEAEVLQKFLFTARGTVPSKP